MSAQEGSEGASPGDAPQTPVLSQPATGGPPPLWRRWGWALLVLGLAILGVLLALADTALYGPYATFLIGPSQVISIPPHSGPPERFIRTRLPELALAAGIATFLLALGAVALLRFTLIFLAVIPAVFIVVLAAALFGIACIGLAFGRLMQRRLGLGPAHPLLAALAGALVVFDLAVIPYIGAVALAAIAIGGLGLTVVTRFGSETGWSFRDLDW